MSETNRTKVGRYETWMDSGTLRLQHHGFNRSGGFTTCMDAKETLKLLELLERNREAIYEAAHVDDVDRSLDSASAYKASDRELAHRGRWGWS